jgi:hypothetical protein
MNNATWLIEKPVSADERRGRPTSGLFGVRTGRRDALVVDRTASPVDAAHRSRFIVPRDFPVISTASAAVMDVAR